MVYGIQLASRIRTERPDDGQRNCPKHVEFYSKNKFEKLVHLIGFIIRIPGNLPESSVFPTENLTIISLYNVQRMALLIEARCGLSG